MPIREDITEWLQNLQNEICAALEKADGGSSFTKEAWTRPEGGGGITRVISGGNVIEKGGVNFSAVHGEAPAFLLTEKDHSAASSQITFPSGDVTKKEQGPTFYATGVSIVIHPKSPMVPIIHMNIRYFEMSTGAYWLGGGTDLTPHYVNENDAKYFHQTLKAICDTHEPSYYNTFKTWADDYFFIKHRNETRGIGGIFFDKLSTSGNMHFRKNLAFWKDVGSAFAPLYVELMNRSKDLPYGENEKQWQYTRRGRYVEFNLVYDKGTKFGLETNGRVESILMSLPPLAAWHYNYTPQPGSKEEKTLSFLKKGIEWV